MGPEVMMIATIASGAMSAMSTMRAGDAKQSEYEVKAAQARANAQREAANAMIEGNNVMRKLQATNSTAVARGFAGGVDGFSGSAKLMQQISNKQAGKDLRMTDLAARESKSFGEVQSMMFLEVVHTVCQGQEPRLMALLHIGKDQRKWLKYHCIDLIDKSLA